MLFRRSKSYHISPECQKKAKEKAPLDTAVCPAAEIHRNSKQKPTVMPKSIKHGASIHQQWSLAAPGHSRGFIGEGGCDPDRFFNDFWSLLRTHWALIFSTCGYFSVTLLAITF